MLNVVHITLPVSSSQTRENTLHSIFKALPEDIQRGKLDSFQGSIPLYFISFYLDNQTSEIGTTSNPSGLLQTVPNEDVVPNTTCAARSETSPQSVESEVDVNAYAEAKMHKMEVERSQTQEQPLADDPNTAMSNAEVSTGDQALQCIVPVRSSTPIPIDAAGASQASLNALESGLRIIDNPGSQLPELLPATQPE